jgi:hypothetical protein
MTFIHSVNTDFLVRLAKYLSDTISPWKCQNPDLYKHVPLCIETCDLLGVDIRPIIEECSKAKELYPAREKICQLLEEKFG